MALDVLRPASMSFASLLSKPSLRAPLLVATVIATVATSNAPGWSRDDSTPSARIDLPVGGTVESRIEVSASEAPELRVVLGRPTATRGQLRVEIDESRGSDCTTRATFTAEGGWHEVTDTSGDKPLEVVSRCSSSLAQGTATIRFVNTGNEKLAFEWLAKATIEGDEDSAPSGAFVEVKAAE